MHIAAMKPTVLSYKELDEQFVKDELAQLNHVIDQDNESRAMVNKPALPHLKYGSKAQLTDEVIAQAEADIKAELAAEGKPEKIWDKIIPGKMDRFMLDNTKVDKLTHFLHKYTSWMTARQLKHILNQLTLQ